MSEQPPKPGTGAVARPGIKAAQSPNELKLNETHRTDGTTIEPTAPQATSTLGDEVPDFSGIDAGRQSVIKEALYAHRAILKGLEAKTQNEGFLNPSSVEDTLKVIRQGIANVEQVISEIDPPAPTNAKEG